MYSRSVYRPRSVAFPFIASCFGAHSPEGELRSRDTDQESACDRRVRATTLGRGKKMLKVLCEFFPPWVDAQSGAPYEAQGWPDGLCTGGALDHLTHLAVVPCSQAKAPRLAVVGKQGPATAPYWLPTLQVPLKSLGRYDPGLQDRNLRLTKMAGPGVVYEIELEAVPSAADGQAAQPAEPVTFQTLQRCHEALDAGWLLFTITYGTCFLLPSTLPEGDETPKSLEVPNPFCIDFDTVAGYELKASVKQFILSLSRKVKNSPDSWLRDHIGDAMPQPPHYAERGPAPEPGSLTGEVRLKLPHLLASLGCSNVSCGWGVHEATASMVNHGWLNVGDVLEERPQTTELFAELDLLAHELAHDEAPSLQGRGAQLHVMRRISLFVYLHAILNAIPLGSSIERRFPSSTPRPGGASQAPGHGGGLAPQTAPPIRQMPLWKQNVVMMGPPGSYVRPPPAKLPHAPAPWLAKLVNEKLNKSGGGGA